MGYDKKAAPAEWVSVTASTFVAPGVEPTREFSTSFKTLSHPAPEDLEEYRRRWITAAEPAAKERFVTENTTTQGSGVDTRFRVRPTRVLPGVPKVVEVFRNKIKERGGMLGIRAIGRMFRIIDDSGDHQLSRVEMK